MLTLKQLMPPEPPTSYVVHTRETASKTVLLHACNATWNLCMYSCPHVHCCRGYRSASPKVMESVGKWVPADPPVKQSELKVPLMANANKQKTAGRAS